MNWTFSVTETLDKERPGIFKSVNVDCFKKCCVSDKFNQTYLTNINILLLLKYLGILKFKF